MSDRKNPASSNDNAASAKKQAVLGDANKKSSLGGVMVAVLFVALAAATGVWYMQSGSDAPSAPTAQATAATPASSPASAQPAGTAQVNLDAAQFADGKARHFSYQAPGGVTIRYFVLKSSDGVIRAAFDACDVCWRSGKGYTQDGDFMVCNNCGRAFQSVKVNEVQGGCNPAPLARSEADGKVIIQVADILEGARYFNFGS